MEGDNVKKTMRTIILLVLVVWCLPCYSQSLVYPFLYKIQINTEVSYDSSNKMFFYTYKLFNNQNNNGNIQEFNIDISRTNNSLLLDTIGLKFASELEEGYFLERYSAFSNKIVPVGVPTVPNQYWTAMFSNSLRASVFADTLFVKPGNSVEGIVLMSKGLPGIRNFTVMPDFQDDLFFSNPDDTTNTDDIDSIRQVINYYGITIGPTAPPINLIPTVWCDTLTSYANQSRSLGWIKDDATANKYLGYFSSAKTKFLQQDNVGARTVLLQVLKDVDIDSTANLTSEAYALISYNTKYLLAQFGFNKEN